MFADQGFGQPTLPNLSLEMAERANGKNCEPVRYKSSNLVTPNVYAAVENEMQSCNVILKCFGKFLPRSFMYKQMHVDI